MNWFTTNGYKLFDLIIIAGLLLVSQAQAVGLTPQQVGIAALVVAFLKNAVTILFPQAPPVPNIVTVKEAPKP